MLAADAKVGIIPCVLKDLLAAQAVKPRAASSRNMVRNDIWCIFLDI